MKGRAMNTQIQTSEQLTTATHAGTGASEMDELAQSSFTAEEIAALFWRRRLVPKQWQRSNAACAPLGVPQVAGRNGQASTIRGVFQAVTRAARRCDPCSERSAYHAVYAAGDPCPSLSHLDQPSGGSDGDGSDDLDAQSGPVEQAGMGTG